MVNEVNNHTCSICSKSSAKNEENNSPYITFVDKKVQEASELLKLFECQHRVHLECLNQQEFFLKATKGLTCPKCEATLSKIKPLLQKLYRGSIKSAPSSLSDTLQKTKERQLSTNHDEELREYYQKTIDESLSSTQPKQGSTQSDFPWEKQNANFVKKQLNQTPSEYVSTSASSFSESEKLRKLYVQLLENTQSKLDKSDIFSDVKKF